MDRRPHLSWDRLHDCWRLNLPISPNNDESFFMLIDHHWDWRENNYVFIQAEMGEELQIVTAAKYQEMLEDIEEHEGEEMRALWHQEQTHFRVERDSHPVFALRTYFEALMTLQVVTLDTTWGIKELPTGSKEFHAKLEAKRQELWKAEQKMMDEAMAEAQKS